MIVRNKHLLHSFLTLVQEIKNRNKSLGALYEELDFIDETWSVQGVIGDIQKQVTGVV